MFFDEGEAGHWRCVFKSSNFVFDEWRIKSRWFDRLAKGVYHDPGGAGWWK